MGWILAKNKRTVLPVSTRFNRYRLQESVRRAGGVLAEPAGLMLVIARSGSDEAIQATSRCWIASLRSQ
jgi:hypothetical protein